MAVGADAKIPAGAKVVDATGKFIIPGLLDARVEIGPSPGNRVSRAEIQIEQRLLTMQAMLAAGVTTTRLIQGDFDAQKLYVRWWGEDLLTVAADGAFGAGVHRAERTSDRAL